MPPELREIILAAVAVDPGGYADKAKRFGVTASAISGIVARANGYKKARARRTQRKVTNQPSGDWDARLFEPYAIRKARRAVETA